MTPEQEIEALAEFAQVRAATTDEEARIRAQEHDRHVTWGQRDDLTDWRTFNGIG